jgi:acyl-CoA reductase-like NAD-dependent aldehyde dehydrogenase
VLRIVEERGRGEGRLDRAVADACARARRAQAAFGGTSLAFRADLVRKLRAALLKRAEELVAVSIDESGKVRAEAITLEIAPAALALTWAAYAGPRALAEERIPALLPLLRRATRSFSPRGVCGLISPYNYALSIPMSTIGPALAAGNAVVWKPADAGTRTAQKTVEIFAHVLQDAGLSPDLLVVIEGGAEAGRALLEGDLDHLTFVGSTAVGRQVAARCGERLLPSVIELGGKAPAIVLDDADLDRASRAIVYGGLANAGQSCVAVERVFAVPAVFDELLARTAALASRIRPGTEVASLGERHRERSRQMIDDARARGARFVGEHVADVTGVDGVRALDEEIFGPLIPFVRVRDADEAITLANAHPLQLCAYVFSNDEARARKVAARLRAPHVTLGDAMISYALMELPFGGDGASGAGRVHGIEGLRALAREQIVVSGHLPIAKEPWWLPYDDKNIDRGLKHLERLLSFLERARRLGKKDRRER